MRRVHLLAVRQEPDAFAPLARAAAEESMRVGWLELRPPDGIPGSLAVAASSGLERAVAVGQGRSVALKALRGAPVLRDLLREHFLGCRLVLVQGANDLPLLEAEGDRWSVESTSGVRHRFGLGELIAVLRKPRPPWLSGESD